MDCDLLSSIETAINLTLVSSCQSSYISAILFNSLVQGLHHVAQKLITMGLPFLRISPDHGPNEKMIGKNKSNPLSLIRSLNFLDKR